MSAQAPQSQAEGAAARHGGTWRDGWQEPAAQSHGRDIDILCSPPRPACLCREKVLGAYLLTRDQHQKVSLRWAVCGGMARFALTGWKE